MSSVRAFVESLYQRHVDELVGCAEFAALETGTAERDAYDELIARVFETHHSSPRFLAFLLALVPPDSQHRVKHNLLEELGIEEEHGESHPAMMESLIAGAGLGDRLEQLRASAQDRHAELVTEPLLYGSLREIGLSALVEIVGFEFMLSRAADRIAALLSQHRGISLEHLGWFTHHGEVDIAHAEQGLDTIADYVAYYRFEKLEAEDIIGAALRENVFIKRYFGVDAAARARGLG